MHEDGKITPKVLSSEAKHRTDLEKSKEAELEVRPLVPCSTVRNGLLQGAITSGLEGLIHHRGQPALPISRSSATDMRS